MRPQKLAGVFVLATGLALVAPSALAQNSGLKAEIEAIKKDIATLQEASANAPTLAQAVQELSSKMVAVEQELAKNEAMGESMPAVVEKLDALEQDVGNLQAEVEYLRTGIANIEQPAAISGGGSTEHTAAGFQLTSGDGRYSMTIGGMLQARYSTVFPYKFESQDSSSFDARRARLTFSGQLDKVEYRVIPEVNPATGNFALLDFSADMQYREELNIRIGQDRVPYTRSFLANAPDRDFLELSESQERQRYDRELGVWAFGWLMDKRLRYRAGVSNGSGINRPNDNIDMALSARVEMAAVGEYIDRGFGDYHGTEKPALTVGLAAVHDLVRLPETVSGIEAGNRDVDANGVVDNVRVISTAADAQFRLKGLELYFEGTYRREQWGQILQHEDNSDLSAAVRASDSGARNYLGFSTQASYFVIPKKLQAGARVSHGRLPLLGISGRAFDSAPPAERLLQLDLFAQFWREGRRRAGFMYSFLNFNAKGADPEPANDKKHQLILEYQLML